MKRVGFQGGSSIFELGMASDMVLEKKLSYQEVIFLYSIDCFVAICALEI